MPYYLGRKPVQDPVWHFKSWTRVCSRGILSMMEYVMCNDLGSHQKKLALFEFLGCISIQDFASE